jgi:ribonuclease E
MSKEIYISSTPHETRLAIVENDALAEIYYERENEYTLAGSIYNGKVTRVLPGMQSSFVDIGLERDAFLYITDFMEEAGDSADFDSNGNGDSARRSDGRRGERNGGAVTLEGSLATPSEETEGARKDRSGDRNGDRNGSRGRGRGRGRDRGGNRDRQASAGLTPGSEETEEGQEIGSDEFNQPIEFSTDNAPVLNEDAGVGEGAPGADGSRRWRGRRGRRRGRGPREEGSQVSGEQTAGGPQEAAGYEVPAEGEYDESFDIDGAAKPTVSSEPVDLMAEATGQESASHPIAADESRSGRGGNEAARNDRGDRNNRGGRDRNDRNRGGRGDRGDRGGREARVPRGFAPRVAFYGVDEAPAYGDAPEGGAVEPIILPGESLSKYRKDAEIASSAPAAAKPVENVIVPSAPGYVVSAGWDGGAILPGETLSRHRRSEEVRQPRAERRERQETGYRNAAVSQEVETPVAAVNEAKPVAFVEEVHHEVAAPVDYEPTDASASYRVDPVAPSEFRQSAPVLDESELVETREELVETHPVETSAAQSVTPAREQHAVPLVTAYEKFDWQTPSAQPDIEAVETGHEITTLHAGGDLSSEAPAVTFIPSAGALVEETQDEEDYNTTLHASSIEEMDDFDEEETLEGAADLGTMLREMSIDQITRSGPDDEVEEDDDLEEEDALHDPVYGNFAVGDDEEEELDEADTEEDVIHEELGEDVEAPTGETEGVVADGAAPAPSRYREGDRGRARRDGRRDGRRDRFGRNDRPRNTGGGGDRERSGGRDRRGGRSSMQSTNLPAINDLLKPGQEILVQIAKEPIAKKGARITSHIALPGRFLVFMPTVNHTGVSRKIESDGERRRLKEILLSEKGDASGGFIVRTAAEGASEQELRNDLRFLLNLWADIKQRSESSKSPALIYHDLNLVERILRDQVTDNFSAIWVDSEENYERILRFLQRFQPSLIRRVKLYSKETPLFEQFGIAEEINKALRSKVWLKSGGSIVINQTEALVAIDINTGKFVGKTARLEDTIVKTNLDAIPEIVRQIRLRDLGGIIIIDFIDMDERKNRNRVMAALEEELKNDRAPSKVLQFNDFGLVAITRKRVKQSLERTLSTTCNICTGTGMVKSPVTVCNDIYIEMRKMQRHLERGDVMLRVNPEVVKQLKAPGTKWLQEMEEMVGKTILVKSDPSLHPEQFDIH